MLSRASGFRCRFRSNNRRNSSKKGLIVLNLKIKNRLILTLEDFFILVLLEFDNSLRGGNLILDLFNLFLLKYKFLFNFSGISSQVTKVDELVVAELSNVFGEFVRGVSPKGGVRADSYFERSHTKGRSYIILRSGSRR